MARKRMTAEERKQSLIEATIRVVARLNYDRATTALIAKEAGINEALIYNHFNSKKDLQIATLDYLINYRIQAYKLNPVFKPENNHQSIMKALNRQYLEMINSPEISVFACILKAMFAIDPEIRSKGKECTRAFHEFIKKNLIEEKKRGFFNELYDPAIIAWEILGKTMLAATMVVNDMIEDFGPENIKKSIQYFESIYLLTNK